MRFSSIFADQPPVYVDRTVITPRSISQERYKTERYAVMNNFVNEACFRLNEPKPLIDAFADEKNNRCARWWGSGGEHPDAFAVSWDQQQVGTLWCNPPFSKLMAVLEKLERDNGRMILIAPDWETKDFYEAMWKFCQRHYFFDSTVPIYELDGRQMPPTLGWGTWCLLLDAKMKEGPTKWKGTKEQRTKSSRRRFRRQQQEEREWDHE